MKQNAKFYIALLTAVVTGVVSVLTPGSTAAQVANFVLVVIGAVGVYFVKNTPAASRRP